MIPFSQWDQADINPISY